MIDNLFILISRVSRSRRYSGGSGSNSILNSNNIVLNILIVIVISIATFAIVYAISEWIYNINERHKNK
jgi:hypothetical protein